MSPHGINSLVGDLVQMAQAMELLPKVQEELASAQAKEQSLQRTIDNMAADLEQSRNYAASLEQKVRSLEVERDDASFRVLESEDLVHECLSSIDTMQSTLGKLKLKLDPPKPEPVKESEPAKFDDGGPYNEPQQGQSVMDPTQDQNQNVAGTTTTKIAQTGESSNLSDTIHSLEDTTSGQSESSPTNVATATASPAMDVSKTQESVTNLDAPSAEPAHGPYSGKRYHDHPVYVSYWDWIDGGGTADSYNWRPTPPIASGSY